MSFIGWLLYYGRAIIFIAAVLIGIAIVIAGALGKRPPKCGQCKSKMEKGKNSWLFLIPVMSDHDYEASSAYYLDNCMPIHGKGEIPTGQRACRISKLTCPECGFRQVLVEDFLNVRDSEVLEKSNRYDAKDFEGLLTDG